MNDFPFDAWLRLSVTVLRISPSEFWAMSICDWLTLFSQEPTGIARAGLTDLMARYPDKNKTPNGNKK